MEGTQIFLHFVCTHFAEVFVQVVNEQADVQCPIVEMPTRSKLSCLSWNKYTKNHLASSDYEGIVTVWDVTTRQVASCLEFTVYLFIYLPSYR